MTKYIIRGGKPLKGAVRIGGAKNSSFKLMIASLLADGQSRLLDISRIGDVEITKQVIRKIGGKIKSPGKGTIFVDGNSLKNYHIPEKLAYKSRASIMFAGPLVSRFGKAVIPFPGGCNIGRRPIERHLDGLRALGIKVEVKDCFINLSATRIKGGRYRFPKNTHTGTETLIMAAVKAEGETLLENAALEIEIDDLINFLNKMGADIKRLPQRKILIKGVKKLKGVIHKAIPDRNEAVSYACAALATQGDIIIENARKDHLETFLKKIEEIGGKYEVGSYGIRFWYDGPLKSANVTTSSHPGFMTDWQALWAVLMTQADGVSEVVETIYEYRFGYIKDLVKMGAKIEFFNPDIKDRTSFYNFNLDDDNPKNFHGVRVFGKSPLKGVDLRVSDLRAGATLVLAALIAKGESTLFDLGHIQRGYEDLDVRLRKLGADIEKIDG